MKIKMAIKRKGVRMKNTCLGVLLSLFVSFSGMAQDGAFVKFNDWLLSYKNGNNSEENIANGQLLAQKRQLALLTLIKHNPEQAIAMAISTQERIGLPECITSLLANNVQGYGTGTLAERVDSEAPCLNFNIGGTTYRAYYYGRRLAQKNWQNIPVFGVEINGNLAIDEDCIKVLSNNNGKIRATVGGRVFSFANQGLYNECKESLLERENVGDILPFANDEYTLTHVVAFNDDDLKVLPRGKFSALSLPNCLNGYFPIGSPDLPVKNINLVLPCGAVVKKIEYVIEDVLLQNPKFPIIPVQEPEPISKVTGKFTQPDMQVYSKNINFPTKYGKMAKLSTLHNYNFLPVTVFPVVYNPSSKQLTFNKKIIVKVTYSKNGLVNFVNNERPNDDTKIVKEFASNHEMLEAAKPQYLAKDNIEVILKKGVEENPQIKALNNGKIEYLIITDSQFFGSLELLANHRRNYNNFGVDIITVSYIEGAYVGRDTQEKIRACISDYYNNNGTQFVLLAGDWNYVPDRDCPVEVVNASAPDLPSDMYYSCLDGTWDDNGNNVFGEPADNPDLLPEVYLGRLPFNTNAQFLAYIHKIIAYETQPEPSILRKIIMGGEYTFTSGIRSNAWDDGHYNDGLCSDVEVWGRDIINDIVLATQFEPTQIGYLFDTLTSWDIAGARPATNEADCGDYDSNSANMTTRFNEGWNFLSYNTHGNYTIWGTEGGFFSSYPASSLTGCTNFMYTIACLTGAWDKADPCLSEAFLRNTHVNHSGVGAGAIVYLGSSRYGWSGSNNSIRFEREWYKQVFGVIDPTNPISPKSLAGIAFTEHKFFASTNPGGYHRWLLYATNLQGDPAARILGILNNDIEVVVTDAYAAEPVAGHNVDKGEFTIRRKKAGKELKLNFAIELNSSHEQLHPASEYMLSSSGVGFNYNKNTGLGTVTIPAGKKFVTISVIPLVNQQDEDCTVWLKLLNSPEYTDISSGNNMVTIVDANNNNKPLLAVWATNSVADERNQKPGAFLLVRTKNVTDTITVEYTIAEGEGMVNEKDYRERCTGKVILEAGLASTPIIITPRSDTLVEGIEKFVFTIIPNSVDPGKYDIRNDIRVVASGTIPEIRYNSDTISILDATGFKMKYPNTKAFYSDNDANGQIDQIWIPFPHGLNQSVFETCDWALSIGDRKQIEPVQGEYHDPYVVLNSKSITYRARRDAVVDNIYFSSFESTATYDKRFDYVWFDCGMVVGRYDKDDYFLSGTYGNLAYDTKGKTLVNVCYANTNYDNTYSKGVDAVWIDANMNHVYDKDEVVVYKGKGIRKGTRGRYFATDKISVLFSLDERENDKYDGGVDCVWMETEAEADGSHIFNRELILQDPKLLGVNSLPRHAPDVITNIIPIAPVCYSRTNIVNKYEPLDDYVWLDSIYNKHYDTEVLMLPGDGRVDVQPNITTGKRFKSGEVMFALARTNGAAPWTYEDPNDPATVYEPADDYVWLDASWGVAGQFDRDIVLTHASSLLVGYNPFNTSQNPPVQMKNAKLVGEKIASSGTVTVTHILFKSVDGSGVYDFAVDPVWIDQSDKSDGKYNDGEIILRNPQNKLIDNDDGLDIEAPDAVVAGISAIVCFQSSGTAGFNKDSSPIWLDIAVKDPTKIAYDNEFVLMALDGKLENGWQGKELENVCYAYSADENKYLLKRFFAKYDHNVDAVWIDDDRFLDANLVAGGKIQTTFTKDATFNGEVLLLNGYFGTVRSGTEGNFFENVVAHDVNNNGYLDLNSEIAWVDKNINKYYDEEVVLQSYNYSLEQGVVGIPMGDVSYIDRVKNGEPFDPENDDAWLDTDKNGIFAPWVVLNFDNAPQLNTHLLPGKITYYNAGISDSILSLGLPVAPFSIVATDKACPMLKSAITMDKDNNGKIDCIDLTYTEPMSATGDVPNSYSVIWSDFEYIVLDAKIDPDYKEHVYLTVAERDIYDTDATPTIIYNGNHNGELAKDEFGNFAQSAIWVVAVDGVGPVMVNAHSLDNDDNNQIDQVKINYSEQLNFPSQEGSKGTANYNSAELILVNNGLVTPNMLGKSLNNIVYIDIDQNGRYNEGDLSWQDVNHNNFLDAEEIPLGIGYAGLRATAATASLTNVVYTNIAGGIGFDNGLDNVWIDSNNNGHFDTDEIKVFEIANAPIVVGTQATGELSMVVYYDNCYAGGTVNKFDMGIDAVWIEGTWNGTNLKWDINNGAKLLYDQYDEVISAGSVVLKPALKAKQFVAPVVLRDNQGSETGIFNLAIDDAWIDLNSNGIYDNGELILANNGNLVVGDVATGILTGRVLYTDVAGGNPGVFDSGIDEVWMENPAVMYDSDVDIVMVQNMPSLKNAMASAYLSDVYVTTVAGNVFNSNTDSAWIDCGKIAGTYDNGDLKIKDNHLVLGTVGRVLNKFIVYRDNKERSGYGYGKHGEFDYGIDDVWIINNDNYQNSFSFLVDHPIFATTKALLDLAVRTNLISKVLYVDKDVSGDISLADSVWSDVGAIPGVYDSDDLLIIDNGIVVGVQGVASDKVVNFIDRSGGIASVFDYGIDSVWLDTAINQYQVADDEPIGVIPAEGTMSSFVLNNIYYQDGDANNQFNVNTDDVWLDTNGDAQYTNNVDKIIVDNGGFVDPNNVNGKLLSNCFYFDVNNNSVYDIGVDSAWQERSLNTEDVYNDGLDLLVDSGKFIMKDTGATAEVGRCLFTNNGNTNYENAFDSVFVDLNGNGEYNVATDFVVRDIGTLAEGNRGVKFASPLYFADTDFSNDYSGADFVWRDIQNSAYLVFDNNDIAISDASAVNRVVIRSGVLSPVMYSDVQSGNPPSKDYRFDYGVDNVWVDVNRNGVYDIEDIVVVNNSGLTLGTSTQNYMGIDEKGNQVDFILYANVSAETKYQVGKDNVWLDNGNRVSGYDGNDTAINIVINNKDYLSSFGWLLNVSFGDLNNNNRFDASSEPAWVDSFTFGNYYAGELVVAGQGNIVDMSKGKPLNNVVSRISAGERDMWVDANQNGTFDAGEAVVVDTDGNLVVGDRATSFVFDIFYKENGFDGVFTPGVDYVWIDTTFVYDQNEFKVLHGSKLLNGMSASGSLVRVAWNDINFNDVIDKDDIIWQDILEDGVYTPSSDDVLLQASHDATLTADQIASGNITIFTNTVYHDLNNNGQFDKEAEPIWIDKNKSGKYYAGDLLVVDNSKYRREMEIVLANRATVLGIPHGVTTYQLSTIADVVYNDANANGSYDEGEDAWVDYDGDGIFDNWDVGLGPLENENGDGTIVKTHDLTTAVFADLNGDFSWNGWDDEPVWNDVNLDGKYGLLEEFQALVDGTNPGVPISERVVYRDNNNNGRYDANIDDVWIDCGSQDNIFEMAKDILMNSGKIKMVGGEKADAELYNVVYMDRNNDSQFTPYVDDAWSEFEGFKVNVGEYKYTVTSMNEKPLMDPVYDAPEKVLANKLFLNTNLNTVLELANVVFVDVNTDGVWEENEYAWIDANNNQKYDATEVVLGEAGTPAVDTFHSGVLTNVRYYDDPAISGIYNLVWQEIGGVDGQYDLGTDILIIQTNANANYDGIAQTDVVSGTVLFADNCRGRAGKFDSDIDDVWIDNNSATDGLSHVPYRFDWNDTLILENYHIFGSRAFGWLANAKYVDLDSNGVFSAVYDAAWDDRNENNIYFTGEVVLLNQGALLDGDGSPSSGVKSYRLHNVRYIDNNANGTFDWNLDDAWVDVETGVPNVFDTEDIVIVMRNRLDPVADSRHKLFNVFWNDINHNGKIDLVEDFVWLDNNLNNIYDAGVDNMFTNHLPIPNNLVGKKVSNVMYEDVAGNAQFDIATDFVWIDISGGVVCRYDTSDIALSSLPVMPIVVATNKIHKPVYFLSAGSGYNHLTNAVVVRMNSDPQNIQDFILSDVMDLYNSITHSVTALIVNNVLYYDCNDNGTWDLDDMIWIDSVHGIPNAFDPTDEIILNGKTFVGTNYLEATQRSCTFSKVVYRDDNHDYKLSAGDTVWFDENGNNIFDDNDIEIRVNGSLFKLSDKIFKKSISKDFVAFKDNLGGTAGVFDIGIDDLWLDRDKDGEWTVDDVALVDNSNSLTVVNYGTGITSTDNLKLVSIVSNYDYNFETDALHLNEDSIWYINAGGVRVYIVNNGVADHIVSGNVVHTGTCSRNIGWGVTYSFDNTQNAVWIDSADGISAIYDDTDTVIIDPQAVLVPYDRSVSDCRNIIENAVFKDATGNDVFDFGLEDLWIKIANTGRYVNRTDKILNNGLGELYPVVPIRKAGDISVVLNWRDNDYSGDYDYRIDDLWIEVDGEYGFSSQHGDISLVDNQLTTHATRSNDIIASLNNVVYSENGNDGVYTPFEDDLWLEDNGSVDGEFNSGEDQIVANISGNLFEVWYTHESSLPIVYVDVNNDGGAVDLAVDSVWVDANNDGVYQFGEYILVDHDNYLFNSYSYADGNIDDKEIAYIDRDANGEFNANSDDLWYNHVTGSVLLELAESGIQDITASPIVKYDGNSNQVYDYARPITNSQNDGVIIADGKETSNVAPIMYKAITADTNSNGMIDQITIYFTKDVHATKFKYAYVVQGYEIVIDTSFNVANTVVLSLREGEHGWDTDATPAVTYYPDFGDTTDLSPVPIPQEENRLIAGTVNGHGVFDGAAPVIVDSITSDELGNYELLLYNITPRELLVGLGANEVFTSSNELVVCYRDREHPQATYGILDRKYDDIWIDCGTIANEFDAGDILVANNSGKIHIAFANNSNPMMVHGTYATGTFSDLGLKVAIRRNRAYNQGIDIFFDKNNDDLWVENNDNNRYDGFSDSNGCSNGHIDHITLTYSENIKTTGNILSQGYEVDGYIVLDAEQLQGNVIKLSLAENKNADTGVTPSVSYNSTLGMFTDFARYPNAHSPQLSIPRDGAAPVVMNISTTCKDGVYAVGGLLDITVTFSEKVSLEDTTEAGTITIYLNTANDGSDFVQFTSFANLQADTTVYQVHNADVSPYFDLDWNLNNNIVITGRCFDASGNNLATIDNAGVKTITLPEKIITDKAKLVIDAGFDSNIPAIDHIDINGNDITFSEGDLLEGIIHFTKPVKFGRWTATHKNESALKIILNSGDVIKLTELVDPVNAPDANGCVSSAQFSMQVIKGALANVLLAESIVIDPDTQVYTASGFDLGNALPVFDREMAVNGVVITPEEASILSGRANEIQIDVQALVSYNLSILTAPQHGTAIFDAVQEKVVYTPAQGFMGRDQFEVQAVFNNGYVQKQIVTLNVGTFAGNTITVNDGLKTDITLYFGTKVNGSDDYRISERDMVLPPGDVHGYFVAPSGHLLGADYRAVADRTEWHLVVVVPAGKTKTLKWNLDAGVVASIVQTDANWSAINNELNMSLNNQLNVDNTTNTNKRNYYYKIVLDSLPAFLTEVTSTTNAGVYTTNDTIALTLQFNEPMTLTGTMVATLNTGATITIPAFTEKSYVTLDYTVANNDVNANPLAITTLVLNQNATLKDKLGGLVQVDGNNIIVAATEMLVGKSIVVNTDIPVAPIVNVVAQTANPRPQWQWVSGGNGAGIYRCQLDGGPWNAESTDTSYQVNTNLTLGNHTLNVQEKSISGAWSVVGSATVTITIPAVTTEDPVNDIMVNEARRFTVTNADVSKDMPLHIVANSTTQHGQITNIINNANGTLDVTYIPENEYMGADIFQVEIQYDGYKSYPATVNLLVGAVSNTISVLNDGVVEGTVIIATDENATNLFDATDQDASNTDIVYLESDGHKLHIDNKEIASVVEWQMSVIVPANEIYILNWQQLDLPRIDGSAVVLVPVDDNWVQNAPNYNMLNENEYIIDNTASAQVREFHFVVRLESQVGSTLAFDLTLKDGWNLVSFPLFLDWQSKQTILTNADITVIWKWNAVKQVYEDVKDIQPKEGIWIKWNSQDPQVTQLHLALSGTPSENSKVTLQHGWNLVGPSIEKLSPLGRVSSVKACWGWNSNNGGYYIPWDDVPAGNAYWIYSDKKVDIWNK